MKFKVILAGILLAAVQSAATAAGDAEAGEKLAHTCLGCHGVQHYVNTYPSYHVPFIAGQHETYIISALQSYRGKQRAHKTMQANASDLTDKNIEDVAAYFASLGGDSDASKNTQADAGSTEATCESCHGKGGLSNIATNPILAGQYESYIEQALKSYREGNRKNPIMGGFASALSDTEISSLAKYFAKQSGPMRTAD